MDDKENKRIMKLQHIEIIDSTLREGEQAPGVVFTEAIRRSIIAGLHRVGIDEIELGVAATVYAHLPGLVREARRITNKGMSSCSVVSLSARGYHLCRQLHP